MSQSVRSVDRALDILLCFKREDPARSLTQIAEAIHMSKTTVHRLLATLENKRFITRDNATGLYRLGLRFIEMASIVLQDVDLNHWAQPYLQRLSSEYGETVDLSILDGAHVIYLEVIESPQRVKLAASTGQRMPAFSTAAGKAILAFLPDVTVMRILERGMPQFTPYTIRTKEELLSNLEPIREQGFSISIQEYEDGINAVAAPVLNEQNYPIAAVTVAGPAYRLTREQMLGIGPSVREMSRLIAQELELASEPDSTLEE